MFAYLCCVQQESWHEICDNTPGISDGNICRVAETPSSNSHELREPDKGKTPTLLSMVFIFIPRILNTGSYFGLCFVLWWNMVSPKWLPLVKSPERQILGVQKTLIYSMRHRYVHRRLGLVCDFAGNNCGHKLFDGNSDNWTSPGTSHTANYTMMICGHHFPRTLTPSFGDIEDETSEECLKLTWRNTFRHV